MSTLIDFSTTIVLYEAFMSKTECWRLLCWQIPCSFWLLSNKKSELQPKQEEWAATFCKIQSMECNEHVVTGILVKTCSNSFDACWLVCFWIHGEIPRCHCSAIRFWCVSMRRIMRTRKPCQLEVWPWTARYQIKTRTGGAGVSRPGTCVILHVCNRYHVTCATAHLYTFTLWPWSETSFTLTTSGWWMHGECMDSLSGWWMHGALLSG